MSRESRTAAGSAMRREVDVAVVTALAAEMPSRLSVTGRRDAAEGEVAVIRLTVDSPGGKDGRAKTVAYTVTGAGKVSAALGMERLLRTVRPRAIICGGIAGSLRLELPPLTVTLAERVSYYDRDATAVGFPLGAVEPGQPAAYHLPRARELAALMDVPTVRIATGDSVVTPSLLENLPPRWREHLENDAELVDMESAVWVEVARRWGEEPVICRTVYDLVTMAPDVKKTTFPLACRTAADALERLIALV